MTRLTGMVGGTFDPVHYGHLRPVLEIQQRLGIDEIRWIPLGHPPHREPPSATPEQRLQMLRLAIAGQPGFVADDRELRREGPSYTLDTLRSLRAEQGPTGHLCVLLGADAFAGFPGWHEPGSILRLAHLIVMHRPGADLGGAASLLHEHQVRHPNELHARPAGGILLQPVTQLEISATQIRALMAAGNSPRYLLPDSVLDLMQQQRIYRERAVT